MDPMPELPDRYRTSTTPFADEAAIVIHGDARFTVLTSRLIRIEHSPSGTFEDRATQTVVNRAFDVPEFSVRRGEGSLEIITEHLHLVHHEGPFTRSSLSVTLTGALLDHGNVWRHGEQPGTFWGFPSNLGGTARTLDDIDGAVELEPGLMSMRGFSVLDDSRSIALTDDGWVAEREDGAADLYFFGYGHDFAACLKDFYALTGPQPLLPRYALGNWWSRYYRYTADSYLQLMDRFAAERLPFSVAVLDMDWHRVDDVPPQYGSGWTGYSWNREFFPDPDAFMAELHRRGLKVTLNVHPASGIQPFEDCYPAVAEAMGVDPADDLGVAFDIVDPEFLRAYFELVHHPIEEQGVDFWWVDWQQGGITRVKDLDPLWMLNHFHFLDSGRRGQRPLTFSRYAGPGSHRYPVGFSGDSIISWDSLDFQPYFTATASNIGYGWWSHDIGGHMLGIKDDELATRWVQLGTFSPINRLHSSNSEFNAKEPWRYNKVAEIVQGQFLRFRHRLVPYLYTMNERAHTLGEPLVLPAYYRTASLETMLLKNVFSFGTDLFVAPITSPQIPALNAGKVKAWLPEGVWHDLFTGLVYDGGRAFTTFRDLADYPVFVKAGAILPLTGEDPESLRADHNPGWLELRVFAGADGSFTLYEDDDAAAPRAVRTRFDLDWTAGRLTIAAAEGELDVVPPQRRYTVRFVGFEQAETSIGTWDERGDLVVELGDVETAAGTTIELGFTPAVRRNDVAGRVFAFLDQAEIPFLTKEFVYRGVREATTPAGQMRAITALDLDADLFEALSEIVLAQE